MATSGPAILTATPTPESARRSWPGRLALGLAALAVAGAGLVWQAGGARLLLGAVGLHLAVRGVVLVRGVRSGALGGRGRVPAAAAAAVGLGVLGVAVTSGAATRWLLLAGVPAVLLLVAAGLLARGGAARRGGQALLVWSVLVLGLLVATGTAQGWARAADVATAVTGLGIAVLAVPLLISAVQLRAVAARPAPPRPAACAGCACAAGGCGLPR